MMNTTIFNALINGYNKHAYTHHYMLGFADRGTVYMALTDESVLPYVCALDSGSRGAGCSLRFKPNKAQKEFLKTCQLIPVCSEKFLEDEFKNSKYNRGEIFEKIITEYFGQVWSKDTVPFWVDGDITVDGVAYQIKYQKATFTSEKQMAELNAARG